MILDQCCWHRLVIKYVYLSFENYMSFAVFFTLHQCCCKTLLHLDHILYIVYSSNYYGSKILSHQHHTVSLMSTSLKDTKCYVLKPKITLHWYSSVLYLDHVTGVKWGNPSRSWVCKPNWTFLFAVVHTHS